MSTLRSTNPMLTNEAFAPNNAWGNLERAREQRSVMTLQGAVNASAILVGICLITGVAGWFYLQENRGMLLPCLFGGLILSFVLGLVTMFKPRTSPWLGPVIAIGEGAFAGGASVMWSSYAQKSTSNFVGNLGTGLVIQALMLTGGIALGLLLAYSTRLIKVTENFKLGVAAATLGLCFVSIGSMLLGFFGVQVPYIWDNGIIGIGFAGVIVVIASLNLVLDFDFIEEGAKSGLPRHMEWYAGIGILVTLVWLYVSILRLLAMLQSRD